MIEIEIDGQSISVADGSTVMDAAAQIGTYIPHFCYHKKLSIAANCRMCLVQVEKAPKPLPACATPVTPGMKVFTKSELAVKAQRGVMEFLLINHPLDCPICDQGGECQLQDLAVGYGGSSSRYQEEKRVVFEKNLGSLVATDMTRCIHCTRCVRFTDEIAGEMELGQAFRGEHAEIMPFVEKTVDSELSGNIIDLCPVGALTSKPFRFSARTWEMSRRRSVSPHDSFGSNLIVQTKHDIVKRVLPFENDSINECWLSDKDRFSYEAINSEDRLTKPMLRQHGQWQEVDWTAALEFAATALKETQASHGADKIGAFVSPHATLEEQYLLQKLLRGLGSDNIDTRLRQNDFSAGSGLQWLGMRINDIDALDTLLVIGSVLNKEAPLLAQRVRRQAKKSLKVLAINPLASADWKIAVKQEAVVAPSLMSATLSGVIVALCRQGELALPEEIADLTKGVNVDSQVEQMAKLLLAGKQKAVWLGELAINGANYGDLQRLAAVLAQLCGAKLGIIPAAANSVGAVVAGAQPVNGATNSQTMINDALPAYVLFGAEAEHDFHDAGATVAALQKAEHVIVFSSFRHSAALQYAELILPLAAFTETAGSFVNLEGRLQSFTGVSKAFAESRPGWKILRVLGNILGLDGFNQDSVEDVRREIFSSETPEFITERLSADIAMQVRSPAGKAAAGELERIADVPIHAADALVRRAEALQKTRDGKHLLARMNTATAAKLAVQGNKIQANGVHVNFVVDDAVANGAIRLPAGVAAWLAAGAMTASVKVEQG